MRIQKSFSIVSKFILTSYFTCCSDGRGGKFGFNSPFSTDVGPAGEAMEGLGGGVGAERTVESNTVGGTSLSSEVFESDTLKQL